jgi:DNA-binding transcriptional LysR family regulator
MVASSYIEQGKTGAAIEACLAGQALIEEALKRVDEEHVPCELPPHEFIENCARLHVEMLSLRRGLDGRDVTIGVARQRGGGPLGHLPFASLEGEGELTRKLRESSDKAGLRLDIRVECVSLPAVCRAVASGACAAVLPKLAGSELPADLVAVMTSPLFADLTREINLVWNPRLLRLRPAAETALRWMEERLRF